MTDDVAGIAGLYLLQDGTTAAPGECTSENGVWRHTESGRTVAVNDKGEPQTLGEAAVMNKAVEAALAGKEPPDRPPQIEPPAAG